MNQISLDRSQLGVQVIQLFNIGAVGHVFHQGGQQFLAVRIAQHGIQIAAQSINLGDDHVSILIVVNQAAIGGVGVASDDTVQLQGAVVCAGIADQAADGGLHAADQLIVEFAALRLSVAADHAVQTVQHVLVQLAHLILVASQSVHNGLLARCLVGQGLDQSQDVANVILGVVGQGQTVVDNNFLKVAGDGDLLSAVELVRGAVHNVSVGLPAQASVGRSVVAGGQGAAVQLDQGLQLGLRGHADVDGFINIQSAGFQDRGDLGIVRSVVVGNDCQQLLGGVGLTFGAGDRRFTNNGVHLALGHGLTVDGVVISLCGILMRGQSQLIAVRNGHSLSSQVNIIVLGSISNGVFDVLSQSFGQIGYLSLIVVCIIDVGPASLCIGLNLCISHGLLDVSLGSASRQGQLHSVGLGVLNQISRVSLVLNNIHDNGDSDVEHVQIFLNRDVSNVQRILDSRSSGDVTQFSHQLIQFCVIHTCGNQSGTLLGSGPVAGNYGFSSSNPCVQTAMQQSHQIDERLVDHARGHPGYGIDGIQQRTNQCNIGFGFYQLGLHSCTVVQQIAGLASTVILLHHNQIQLAAIGSQLIIQSVDGCLGRIINIRFHATDVITILGQLNQLGHSQRQGAQCAIVSHKLINVGNTGFQPACGIQQGLLGLLGHINIQRVGNLDGKRITAVCISARTVGQSDGFFRFTTDHDIRLGGDPTITAFGSNRLFVGVNGNQFFAGLGVTISTTDQVTGTQKSLLRISQVIAIRHDLTNLNGGLSRIVGSKCLQCDAHVRAGYQKHQGKSERQTPLQNRRSYFHLISSHFFV